MLGIAITSAVAGMTGQIMSGVSQKKAAAVQRQAAERSHALALMNADIVSIENARKEAGLEAEQFKSEAANRAKIAASGFTTSGSLLGVLDENQETNRDALRWLMASGDSRVAVAKEGADIALLTGQAQADLTAASAASSFVGSVKTGLDFAQSGMENDWWS